MLPLSEVKWVTVPHYDELSVKTFLPKFENDYSFMKYIPEVTMESRIPARDYFWNILNTVHHDYVQKVIQHANNLRMQANEESKPREYIEVSEQWWDKLNAVPFVSCKFFSGPLPLLTKFLTHLLFLCRTQGENTCTPQAVFEASPPDTQTHQAECLRWEWIPIQRP